MREGARDSTTVQLRDGTPAMIWALSPDDGRGLKERYAQLSPESKYNRFLTSVRELSDRTVRLLVDDVDGVEHVALVLVVFPADAHERTAGIGRIIRYRDQPDAADVAVTVEDEWQGRGVATALMRELVTRRPPGVQRLQTHVAAGNPASLAMLRALGETQVSSAGPGVLDVRVLLSPTAEPGPSG